MIKIIYYNCLHFRCFLFFPHVFQIDGNLNICFIFQQITLGNFNSPLAKLTPNSIFCKPTDCFVTSEFTEISLLIIFPLPNKYTIVRKGTNYTTDLHCLRSGIQNAFHYSQRSVVFYSKALFLGLCLEILEHILDCIFDFLYWYKSACIKHNKIQHPSKY